MVTELGLEKTVNELCLNSPNFLLPAKLLGKSERIPVCAYERQEVIVVTLIKTILKIITGSEKNKQY